MLPSLPKTVDRQFEQIPLVSGSAVHLRLVSCIKILHCKGQRSDRYVCAGKSEANSLSLCMYPYCFLRRLQGLLQVPTWMPVYHSREDFSQQ